MSAEPKEEAPDEVIIQVETREFRCSKTHLAEHSQYFDRMFFTTFTERNQKEVYLEGVKALHFELFLELINGTGAITDTSVEPILRLSQYLEACATEQKSLAFLMGESTKTLKEKFGLGDKYRLEPLIIHILSNVNSTQELETIAPITDISSLSNTTKAHVLRKSYNFQGIPEDYVFQDMLNQALDQAEEEERRRVYQREVQNVLNRVVDVANPPPRNQQNPLQALFQLAAQFPRHAYQPDQPAPMAGGAQNAERVAHNANMQ